VLTSLGFSLSTGVAISVAGNWKRCPPGKEQSHELHANEVQVLGQNDAAVGLQPPSSLIHILTTILQNYPIQKKYHTPEYLRSLPHLRSRTSHNALLLRLRSQVIANVTTFFSDHGFIQSHTPIITSSDCEGAGEVFTVASNTAHELPQTSGDKDSERHFFRSPKYLTVSSQLHLEALAQSVGNVWTLSPTFRAEKSDTSRHLSEFYMLEAEIAFVDKHEEVMDVVERMLRYVATKLKTSLLGKELVSEQLGAKESHEGDARMTMDLQQRWDSLISGPWPRITYHEAIARLKDAVKDGRVDFEFPPDATDGLQAEHERFLAEDVGQMGPVFVTDYPRAMKPFYMAPSQESMGSEKLSQTVACFDLLLPDVCEVVGGSMREHRLENLLQAMREKGRFKYTKKESAADEQCEEHTGLEWYLDLRRYGSVPHGGFGLGFDRLLAYLGGISNIRDIVAFPRWYGRCVC